MSVEFSKVDFNMNCKDFLGYKESEVSSTVSSTSSSEEEKDAGSNPGEMLLPALSKAVDSPLKKRKEKTGHPKSDANRPNVSYSTLIAMSILSNPDRKLQLQHIYEYILQRFPYYRTCTGKWKNCVRHTLSLNDRFVKLGRQDTKGNFWAINEKYHDELVRTLMQRKPVHGELYTNPQFIPVPARLPHSYSTLNPWSNFPPNYGAPLPSSLSPTYLTPSSLSPTYHTPSSISPAYHSLMPMQSLPTPLPSFGLQNHGGFYGLPVTSSQLSVSPYPSMPMYSMPSLVPGLVPSLSMPSISTGASRYHPYL